MGVHNTLDVFSGAMEQYEAAGWSVRDVEVTAGEEDDGTLRATLTVPLTLATESDTTQETVLAPDTASVTEQGALQVEFPMQGLFKLPEELDAAVTQTERSVRVSDDDIILRVDLTIESAAEARSTESQQQGADRSATAESPATTDEESATDTQEGEQTDQISSIRDESVPPYEDIPYLQCLYESCSTFAEMSWRIDMDVSSETVRRYMIEAGIHDPSSYETASTGGETDTATRGTEDRDSGTDGTGDAAAEDTESASVADSARAVVSDGSGDHESASADTDSMRDEPTAEEGTATATESSAGSNGSAAEELDQESLDAPTETVDLRASLADEQLLAEGIGLPADLDLEDVADAVVEATTVYEVQQRLDTELENTRELLKQLNLLDLVLHRVSSPPAHAPSYEMVASRIDQCRAEKA